MVDLQDVFDVFPGDTDYRMFANDYGDIPGLDIIFLLGGYFYHTSFDTVDRLLYASTGILVQITRNFSFNNFFFTLLSCTFFLLNRPGSMQARGDNLFRLMKAFANSSKLLTALERESLRDSSSQSKGERPIFFDYFARFLVCYDFFQWFSWPVVSIRKWKSVSATFLRTSNVLCFVLDEWISCRSFTQKGKPWYITLFRLLSSSLCRFYCACQLGAYTLLSIPSVTLWKVMNVNWILRFIIYVVGFCNSWSM